MLKLVHSEVWAFDCEWVPDPATGRRTYELAADMPDEDVVAEMWRRGGATEEDPRPYLKTVLCRVVSVAAVIRKRLRDGSTALSLYSLPTRDQDAMPEHKLLDRFLAGVGRAKPQLVGFNSANADITILVQRGVALGIQSAQFAARPNKPWEGIDYFGKGSDFHIDLMNELSGWGRGAPTLHELATACGVPGKIGTDGRSVIDLWNAGEARRIVQYNECDALTTYLVWLRLAHFAGLVATEAFHAEEAQLEKLLEQRAGEEDNAHLGVFLDRWRALRSTVR